jgi:hypothetical protein
MLKEERVENDGLGTLPKTPLVFDGITYHLCGDFGALIKAEQFFNISHDVNLLFAILKGRDAGSVLDAMRQLLPCALHTFHPRLSFDGSQAIIDRMVAAGDPSFVRAIGQMWPAETEERKEASRNLCFDLDSLADANEHFGGTGLGLFYVEGPLTLEHAYNYFPCAVHRFRPELNLAQARQLMTLPSVFLVIEGLAEVRKAPRELHLKFIERLGEAASDEERLEVLFRTLAQKPWPGTGQA